MREVFGPEMKKIDAMARGEVGGESETLQGLENSAPSSNYRKKFKVVASSTPRG
jgi:hypothetical protein